MREPTSQPSSDLPPASAAHSLKRIGRALLGSLIAGGLAILLYRVLSAIAVTFANKPVTSDNVTVINLSAAVRTLVLGIFALGTGVFGFAAIGLLLLAGQMLLKRLSGKAELPTAPDHSD